MAEPEEEEEDEEVEPDLEVAEDIAIERASAEQMYQGGFLMAHPARWTRVRARARRDITVPMGISETSEISR